MRRGESRTFVIRPGDAATLGRSSHCTVPLRDPKVSRRHCQLSFAQGHVVAVDFDSRHGILHLGQRKAILALQPGDGIHVGETFVRFAAVDEVDEATVAGWFAPGGIYAAPPADPFAGEVEDDAEGEGGDRLDGDAGPVAAAAAAPTSRAEDPPATPSERVAAWPPAPPAGAPSDPPPAAAPPLRAAEPPRQQAAPTIAPAAPASPAWRTDDADADDYPEVARPGEPLRLRPESRRRPASAPKAFTARLAAEAIIFSIHMVLCIALLLALRAVFGFDLYRAAGFAGG